MWLIEQDAHGALQQAYSSGISPSAEQQKGFIEARGDSSGGRIMTAAGDQGEIHVTGVLTPAPDFMAAFFGGGNTTYPEIIGALAQFEADDEVTEVTMRMNSPGGHINGMFETIAAMQNFSKPINVVVEGLAASAAFALASQGDKITASTRASRVGSIGIVVEAFINDKVVSITSTNAPKKRPDLSTEEGQAVIREELDATHDLFVEAISEGRNTTIEKVNADFGQGATLLADEALKRGMIDGIAVAKLKSVPSKTAKSGLKIEGKTMNLEELKASHPDVFAAAVKIGADEERDRVNAHLTMGTTSGDMITAVKAIEGGDGMTATLQAKYMAAGMNKAAGIAAAADDEEVADAVDNVEKTELTEQAKDDKANAKIEMGVLNSFGLEAKS